jgi:HEAT repeat protein
MAVSQKKGTKKEEAIPSKSKQYILLGVVVALFAFAGFMFFSGGGSSDSSAPIVVPQSSRPPMGVGPEGGMAGPGMGPPMGMPGTVAPAPAPAAPVAGLEKPKTDPTGMRLTAAIGDYFKQYEATVKNGQWKQLSAWAYSHGLYVETLYCDAMDTGISTFMPKLHESILTVTDPTSGQTTLMSQQEYERTQTQKPTPKMSSYSQVVSRIKDLPSGGGSSNLSRLASLLVQADCAQGRELYRESIKDKKFYPILIRAISQAYLGQELENQAWEASWRNSTPMNLWLIEQMIDLDPAVFEEAPEKSKDNQQGQANGPMGPGGPPGMPPGMGPMGPMGGPVVQEVLPGLSHRKLMLSVLSRRGGMVSSHLIGRLIAKDKNNTLLKGIMQGQVDGRLLRRFTGIYAEPMAESLTAAFKTIDVSSPGWMTAVEMLAGMNNDQISYLIFSSASERGILSSKAVLMLAASANDYTLGELTKFVEGSKVQDVPVESVVGLWTYIPPQAKQSLWKLMSGFIPNVQMMDSQSNPMAGPSIPEAARMPGGVKMPEGMMPPPPPGMANTMLPGGPMQPGMMPPGGPMAPGMMPPGYMMSMPGGMPGQEAMRTRGWPLERDFYGMVNSQSAIKFLMALGRLKVDASKVYDPNMGPGGPMMMPPPNMGMMGMASSMDETAKARVRQTAIRFMVVLDDPALAEYFRNLINDKQAGDYARLGLCILDDRASIKPLLNRFWKQPLEINTVLVANGTSSNPETDKIIARPGKISVPLDAMGLPRAGCSARDAMIYFDNREAGQAFLSALGELITHKDAFDHPQAVADAACALINGLGRWSVPGTASTLADLIESTSDFGLRGDDRSGNVSPDQNQLPMQVRLEALSVLGAIGDAESMNVILRIATYSRKGEILGLAAQIALAKRGTADAGDLFLDMLDPSKADKNAVNDGNITAQIAKIDPSFKTIEDIALLGLSKIELNEVQIPRAIKLMQTLGERKDQNNGVDLQEQMVLSLLRAGQGSILNAIAEMISTAPKGQGQEDKEPFYWNRNGSSQDQMFMKMITALSQGIAAKDSAGATAVISAVIRREEKLLLPSQEMESWDPKQYLVQFGNSNFSFGGSMMPMGMPMPNMMQAAAPTDASAAKTSPKYEPNFNFPSMESSQGLMEQSAAMAGIKLMGKLNEAQQSLESLKKLSYYRYMAGFMLWQIGSDAEGDTLVELLAESSGSIKESYLKFLAIDQLARTGNSGLGTIFARALSRVTDRAIQAKLGDGAVYLSMKTWKDQMMGGTSVLRDTQQVDAQIEAWRPKVEAKGYDRMLADRMVITLATLQENDESLKWMADIVRQQCSRSDPVSETAVGESVRILSSLNSAGKTPTLEYYLTLLNQTVDPDKARQAAEKAQAMPMMPPPGMGPGGNGMMPPNGPGMGGTKRTRTPRQPVVRSAPVKRAKPVPVYRSVGPAIVKAIGQMNEEDVLPSLLSLARSRADLIGSIAVEVCPRDNRQGQKLFKQLINDSGKSSDSNAQVQLGLAYLLEKNDPLAYELLVQSVIKSDSAVSTVSLQYLMAMYKEGKLPESLDINKSMRTIIQGLISEKRSGREVSQSITEVMKFAEGLDDKEIGRLLERLRLVQEGGAPRVR